MQNVVCENSIDIYPLGQLTIRKNSISAIPVTMSALSIGILLKAMSVFSCLGFIADIPMTAIVPTTVAMIAARIAIENVFTIAPIISRLWNSSAYQCRLNPVHTDIDFASLKESTIRVSIGRYRNSIINNT